MRTCAGKERILPTARTFAIFGYVAKCFFIWYTKEFPPSACVSFEIAALQGSSSHLPSASMRTEGGGGEGGGCSPFAPSRRRRWVRPKKHDGEDLTPRARDGEDLRPRRQVFGCPPRGERRTRRTETEAQIEASDGRSLACHRVHASHRDPSTVHARIEGGHVERTPWACHSGVDERRPRFQTGPSPEDV